jgi:MFS family permease
MAGFGTNGFIVVLTGAMIITLSMGLRQSQSVFQIPIVEHLGTGREAFGFAIAIGFLVVGLAQPFVGALADRLGAGRVAATGGVVYALGLFLVTRTTNPTELTLTLGVLIGAAMSATTYIVVLGAVARAVPAEKRGAAFGIATAAGSLGMFLLIPFANYLLVEVGWIRAFYVMACLGLVMVVLSIGIGGKRNAPDGSRKGQTAFEALREARGHSGFWLLCAGFFVCGFHVSFIGTHLPAYFTDHGMTPADNAFAFALIGLFNIGGSFFFGTMGDKFRKKFVLSILYLTRSVAIAAFVLAPFSTTSAYLFGATMGFVWLGTVPLTNGIVAQVFGLRHLSMLSGIVFMCHQLGSFSGAWGAGYVYDTTGSYDIIWIICIALGLVATVLHMPIADRPIVRAEPVAG